MNRPTTWIRLLAMCLVLSCLGIESAVAQDPEWIDFPTSLEGDVSYVEVASSSTTGLSLRVALPGMYTYPIEMADGQTYTAVSVPGAKAFETGKPAVPVFSEWILIPDGTEAVVSVDWGAPLVYNDMYLPPGQPLSGDCDGELILPFAKDEETYGIPGDCPGEFAWLEPTQMLRGRACAIIWLFPYQHDPVARTLKVYPQLRVNILFQSVLAAAIPPDEVRSAAFDAMMRRMAVNGEAIIPEEVPPGEYETGPYGWDYIILIGETAFEPAANKLAAWKKKLGFKPLVHKVPAKWDALAMKTALEGAYKNWQKKPKYLLIIGDAEYVPCWYETWHPHNFENLSYRCECTSGCVQEPKNTQHYVATDLYYATMDGPTDSNPEMFMGRLSVDTASQAMKRVDDIIEYEKSPVVDPTFYSHATVAAEFEDNDLIADITGTNVECPRNTYEDKRFVQTSEDVALFLEDPPFNKTMDRIYYAEAVVTPMYWNNETANFGGGPAGNPGTQIPSYLLRSSGFAWNGSGENIANALNSGRFLLTYRGHGARDHWRTPKFDAQTFQALNNGDKLPVIWSLSCQTGWFDNETDYFWMLGDPYPTDLTPANLVCFSEQWERRPTGGAIGIVAGTRVTFGFLNEHLSWGMMDAIWPSFIPSNQPVYNTPIRRMGEVLYYGRQHMMKAKVSSTDEKLANYEAYHWFGDPAMEIRTTKPIQIVTAHPKPDWPWMLHPRDFIVEVLMNDGDQYQGPLEKATVTISKQDSPSDYWVGKTDEEGQVTFSGLVTSALGEYDVVVTAADTTTYEGTFESVAGPGGILLDAEIYGCPSDVGIKVADADLAGVGSLYQVVETGIDVEIVELNEAPAGSGVFEGTIPATFSPDVHGGDGILQVTDGVTISVVYADQADTALVDCDPPGFEGLAMAQRNRERGCVELEWVGAYDDHGPILYNIYRYSAGSDTGILIGTTWSESYTDFDAAPGQTYRYVVRAQDAAGNEEDNMVERLVTGSIPIGAFLLLL